MSTYKIATVNNFWFSLLSDIFYHLILFLRYFVLLGGFKLEYEFLDVSNMDAKFVECRSGRSFKKI